MMFRNRQCMGSMLDGLEAVKALQVLHKPVYKDPMLLLRTRICGLCVSADRHVQPDGVHRWSAWWMRADACDVICTRDLQIVA